MIDGPIDDSIDARAQEVFEAFLETDRTPSALEELCSRHPTLAGDLRRLHELYQRGLGAVDGMFVAAGGAGLVRYLSEITGPRGSDSYEVLKLLGRGGICEVEKVWDARLGRELARKVLPLDVRRKDLAASEWRKVARFLDEVRLTSRLQHPGILPVHEAGMDERGRPFFTMPVVRGRHLGEIIARLRSGEDPELTTTRVLQLLIPVCEALAYAHEHGVVHRDLKPENIMVGRFGETFVMDWGLAKVVEDATDGSVALRAPRPGSDEIDPAVRTLEGDVVGTPAYMAPEQAAGQVSRIDRLSDQYGVGAILYQLLTGQRPYADHEATTPEDLVLLVRTTAPTPVCRLVREAPPELVAICDRAMARDPIDRYPTMSALAADLRAFLEIRAVQAYDAGLPAVLRKWARRNRRTALAWIFGLIAVAAGITLALLLQAERARELFAEQELSAKRLEDLEREAYLNDLITIQRTFTTNESSGQVREILDRCPARLRGWEWDLLDALADESTRTFVHGDRDCEISTVALTPDGKVLATGGHDHWVKLWDTESGSLLHVLPQPEITRALAFSPDGNLLAVSSGLRQVRLFDWKQTIEIAMADVGWKDTLLFSKDGHLLAGYGRGRHIDVLSVPNLSPLWRSPNLGIGFVLAQDGSSLLAGTDYGTIFSFDFASGTQNGAGWRIGDGWIGGLFIPAAGPWLAMLSTHELFAVGRDSREISLIRDFEGGDTGFPTLFLDDSLCAFSRGSTLYVADVRTGEIVRRWQGHVSAIRRIISGSDGETLYSCDLGGIVKQWRWNRSVLRRVSTLPAGAPHDAALSPDGRYAAIAGNEGLLLYDLEGNGEPAYLRGEVISVSFTIDGTALLTGGDPLRFHRVPDLQLTRQQPELEATLARLSPDGRSLAVGSTKAWAARQHLRVFDWPQITGARVSFSPAVIAAMAFAPSGRELATAADNGRVCIYDVSTLERRLDVELDELPLGSIAWSPLGHELAVGTQSARIWILDVRTGAKEQLPHVHRGQVLGLAYTPDGSRLFSGGNDAIRIWDSAARREVFTLDPATDRGKVHGGHRLAISADGRVLLATRDETGSAVVYRLPAKR